MKIPSYKIACSITGLSLSALLISACSTPATPVAQTQVAVQETTSYTQAADFYYTVERGDLLASIALRFTGNADNWTTIAGANDLADPRKLRAGQQLVIPGFLLPPVETKSRTSDIPTSVALRSIERRSEPSINSIDDVGPDAVDVEVNKANPNKQFVLLPLGSDVSGDSAEIVGNDYIKIIGSYFPKVVYQSPRLNAKLLMRVAPGTTFPLEKLDDGWYQISTDQGPGYLRTQDGQPTDTTEG